MKSQFTAFLTIVWPIFPIILLSGCQTRLDESGSPLSNLPPGGPAILAAGSPDQIRRAGISDARADIAANRPRIAITGGFAAWPVGVPEQYFTIVQRYPNVPLPCGCTSAWLREAGIYAEAYNHEILPYLLNNKLHHQ